MLKKTSSNFGKLFILEFTKEMIRATKKYEEERIRKEVKKIIHKEKSNKNIVKKIDVSLAVHEKMKRDVEKIKQLKEVEEWYQSKLIPAEEDWSPSFFDIPKIENRKRYMRIPEIKLPETLTHLRPVPTSQYIDLGKLNPLINDPIVKKIECDGPNEKIIVEGLMGRKYTKITLTKEEINEIIEKFSEASKIPIIEGIFRVVFGKIIFTAIISNLTDPKFIITKMSEVYHVPMPTSSSFR
ncbi:MAG: hypothetical protein QXD63_01470 [Candidatus Pacearchaeota archaeon]